MGIGVGTDLPFPCAPFVKVGDHGLDIPLRKLRFKTLARFFGDLIEEPLLSQTLPRRRFVFGRDRRPFSAVAQNQRVLFKAVIERWENLLHFFQSFDKSGLEIAQARVFAAKLFL